MEGNVDADRANLEKDIIYMLRFLSIASLIRVLNYIRRIW